MPIFLESFFFPVSLLCGHFSTSIITFIIVNKLLTINIIDFFFHFRPNTESERSKVRIKAEIFVSTAIPPTRNSILLINQLINPTKPAVKNKCLESIL